jgi:hypothetical protein
MKLTDNQRASAGSLHTHPAASKPYARSRSALIAVRIRRTTAPIDRDV